MAIRTVKKIGSARFEFKDGHLFLSCEVQVPRYVTNRSTGDLVQSSTESTWTRVTTRITPDDLAEIEEDIAEIAERNPDMDIETATEKALLYVMDDAYASSLKELPV